MFNTFLFKVVYWDEVSEKESVTYHLLRASSFSEAVKVLVEGHYADTIISFEVECFEDYCGQIPESAIDAVRHFYREEI